MARHVNYNDTVSHFRNSDNRVLSSAVDGYSVITHGEGRNKSYEVRKGDKLVHIVSHAQLLEARALYGLTGKGRTPTYVIIEYALSKV